MLTASLVLVAAALPGDVLPVGRESDTMCDQIRTDRKRVPPGRGQCESLTDPLLCEVHYYEVEAASGGSLSVCGIVADICQTVAHLECAAPHLISTATSATGRQLTKDPALRVNCERLDCIVEDLWADTAQAEHTSFIYGVCKAAGNKHYYIAGEQMCHSDFTSGRSAMLEFRVPSGPPPVGSTRADGARPSYELNNAILHEFVGIATDDILVDDKASGRGLALRGADQQGANGQPARSRRSLMVTAPGSDPHDVLTLRLKFSDGLEPSCDEACVDNGMFGTTGGVPITHNDYPTTVMGSVNGNLQFSSYGISSFTSNRATLTVTLSTPMPGSLDGCPFYDAMDAADVAALSQHGADASTYSHVEYFLPNQFGKCAWAGLASVGCNRPGTGPRPGGCFSLIKDSWPTTRMHEFGHNLVSPHIRILYQYQYTYTYTHIYLGVFLHIYIFICIYIYTYTHPYRER